MEEAETHAHVDAVDALGLVDGEASEALVLVRLAFDVVLSTSISTFLRCKANEIIHSDWFGGCPNDEREELECERHIGFGCWSQAGGRLDRVIESSNHF